MDEYDMESCYRLYKGLSGVQALLRRTNGEEAKGDAFA